MNVATIYATTPSEYVQQVRPDQYMLGYRSSSAATTNRYTLVDGATDLFGGHFAQLDALAVDARLLPDDTEPPSEISLAWARALLREFQRFALAPDRVVASADGGAAICFVRGPTYTDIECLNSGEILGVISTRGSLPIVWEVEKTASDVDMSIARIREAVGANQTPVKNVSSRT